MIDCLIFTKNRACQLDALLRSVKENFPAITKINIIYKASDNFYLAGYEKLQAKFSEHNWKKEENLVQDIKNAINNFNNEFCLTLVDDEIVIRNQGFILALDMLRENSHIHCLSLRMGPNVDYTYTANLPSPPPEFTTHPAGINNIYQWDWRIPDGRTDWGYPSCINSHVYRTNFLKPLVLQLPFTNVNNLEGLINNTRACFPPFMICFDKPTTINIANNLVQSGTNRHSNKEEFSLESLNRKFLDGFVIDIRALYDLEINMATFEKDYTFIWGP